MREQREQRKIAMVGSLKVKTIDLWLDAESREIYPHADQDWYMKQRKTMDPKQQKA
jgi:hypothetical protein